jgi:hypothetical protein
MGGGVVEAVLVDGGGVQGLRLALVGGLVGVVAAKVGVEFDSGGKDGLS